MRELGRQRVNDVLTNSVPLRLPPWPLPLLPLPMPLPLLATPHPRPIRR